MSFVKLSDNARVDLERLYDFLAQYDLSIANRAKNTIIDGLGIIEKLPMSGSPVSERPNVRKLVIDFGATGYLVFHKRYEKQGMNFVARIIHQKEWYDEATIGITEEFLEENNQQIADIKAGIQEADRGDFASKKELSAVFKKYGAE